MAIDTTLNDKMARNEMALVQKIRTTTINSSIWNTDLIKKEPWEDGMADTHQVLTVERNLAANADVWTNLAPVAGGSGTSCVLTADVMPNGSTPRQFTLQGKAIESDDVCVEAGRNAYQTKQQIAAMYQNLRNNIKYIWKRRGVIGYFETCENKCVCAPGRPTASDHIPTIAATSKLTQKFLNSIYEELIGESAEEDGGSLTMVAGRPQFILITDAITSDDIMREDTNNQAFLYSQRTPELLLPLGVDRGFRGFFHQIEKMPRRFTNTDGVYTEVLPYETVEATNGYKARVREAYKQAPFTESFIFLPTVMNYVVPNAISSFGSGTTFEAQSYIGEIKWNNEYDRETNPDRTIGQYRAVIKSGIKPGLPQFGYSIIHLRCPDDLGLTACTASDEGASSDLGSDEHFAV